MDTNGGRKFIKRTVIGIGAILAVGSSLLGCKCDLEPREIHHIQLEELISNPELYKGEVIITEGYPEYIGERSYFRFYPYPYYNPISKSTAIKLSMSEVTLTTHYLHTEADTDSEYFVITEETGGLYLPIPFVLSSGTFHDELTRVRGRVEVDKDDNYQLDVYFAEELDE